MPSTTSLISGPTKPSARSITPDSYCHSEDYSYLDSQTSSHPHPQTTFHHSNSSDYNLYHGTGAREFMTQPVAVYNQPQKDSADVDLPPLQAGDAVDKNDKLEPIAEDDPTSYNLVAPAEGERDEYSLEKRSLQLFSKEHLQVIFADPTYLLKFTSFLGAHRPQSVPILIHYLDALKALRTIQYSNAILEGLDPIDGIEFTKQALKPTINTDLEARADGAFDILVRDELPAFVTHQYINIVTSSIASRITGALSPYLREASEGLAEVFCLTDPSRPDNPIVFASEEFNRTTQYGMGYTIGRNCRFLQGPQTNSNSTRRFREMIEAGKPHQETFLNYRRDGSPFMNLLMCAPLTDSRGVVRYFIGAQVDVSGLVKDCVELESLSKLLDMQAKGQQPVSLHQSVGEIEDPLRDLAEMMNQGETTTIARFGGRMHREIPTNGEVEGENGIGSQTAPSHERILIKDPETLTPPADMTSASGRLRGIYQNVSGLETCFSYLHALTNLAVSTHSAVSSTPYSLCQSFTENTWLATVSFPR